MRPRGEVRQAVAAAAWSLAEVRGAFTFRDVAAHSQVGYEKTRETLKDMARAGELLVVGETRAAGVSRPLNLYRPAEPVASRASGAGADMSHLVQAVRRWADFR